MSFSRKQCNILRGLAILSIVLHNFLHQTRFGFTGQNESSFDIERTQGFLASVFSDGVWNAFCEIFSFLGWIGVPVFVFLSGYGLVKKYEQEDTPLKIWPYLKHSWLKLFLLMLPGVLFCALFNQFLGLGGLHVQLKYAAYLSLLGNLFGLDSMTPSIYWYFGLTFELYLAYIVLNKYRSRILLILGITLPLILQICLLYTGKENLVHFNLRNMIGWLPMFCTGVFLGRYKKRDEEKPDKRWWIYLLSLLLSAALLIPCNKSPWCWALIHFVSFAFFFSLFKLIDRLPHVNSVFVFIGSYASFIFAAHPIARIIVNECRIESWGAGLELLLYLLFIAILVPLYRIIVVKLTALFQ